MTFTAARCKRGGLPQTKNFYMKNFAFLLAGLFLFAAACTDPEKDPFQLEKIKKASIIALRGTAFDNLQDISFRGSIAKLSKAGDPAAQTVEFEADFLSDDVNSLSEVQVYAKATETGARTKIGTIAGSAFAVPAGEINRRGKFSVSLSTVLTAIGKNLGDFNTNDYIFLECDLTLTDGSTVPASSIVNLSLFESAIFYPAHNLRCLVVD